MRVSIVIPNFNGKDLLAKNLPNILACGAEEAIVLDDGSTDGSSQFLKSNFPQVKLLTSTKNLGFVPSVNRLFEETSGEVVVLLNNDVWVDKKFLPPLIKHFSNPKVFAVNCHEEGEGPAEAFLRDGFFEFRRGRESQELKKSSWASGGSAAYNREIWRKLGGFDEVFAPFYFEDVDLSFRAIKAGFEIFWEPNSKVLHQHETTIGKSFGKRYVEWIKQRNQLLFIWKNITDPKLIREHRLSLARRLFIKEGLGYWIPFLWALSKIPLIRYDKDYVLSDQEAIEYVGS